MPPQHNSPEERLARLQRNQDNSIAYSIEAEEKIADLEAETERLREENGKLRREKLELQKEAQHLMREKEHFAERLNTTEKRLQDAKERVRAARAEDQDAQRPVVPAESAENTSASLELASTRAQLETMKGLHLRLLHRLAALSDHLNR